ncbi:hypothetical protein J6590_065755 [Homalodisca vitripennis]|nr:hypothetical protein J6590_065755 [Homalodisca vitripennis]
MKPPCRRRGQNDRSGNLPSLTYDNCWSWWNRWTLRHRRASTQRSEQQRRGNHSLLYLDYVSVSKDTLLSVLEQCGLSITAFQVFDNLMLPYLLNLFCFCDKVIETSPIVIIANHRKDILLGLVTKTRSDNIGESAGRIRNEWANPVEIDKPTYGLGDYVLPYANLKYVITLAVGKLPHTHTS